MASRTYYVTVIDPYSQRKGFLLGPYKTQYEALKAVNLGRKLAFRHDPKAPWYLYGTAGAPADSPTIKTVFGLGLGLEEKE